MNISENALVKRVLSACARAALIALLISLAVAWMAVGHGEARSVDTVLMIYM